MGLNLLIISWIVFLISLTIFFNKYLEKSIYPNQAAFAQSVADGEQVLQLEINRYQQYLAPGSINGSSVTFLIDTGATGILIPSDIANKLQLTKGHQISSVTANGTAISYTTVIKSFSIGGITLPITRAYISDSYQSEEILLGMDALKYFDVSMEDGVLTLSYKG